MSNKRIILEGCINQFKTQNELELKDSEIFELFTLTQISKSFDLSFENLQNSIVDGGNDGGIDSVLVLIDDKIVESVDALSDFSFSNRTYCRFVISQCKKENSFKEGPLDKLITTFPALFDLEKTEADLLKRFNADLVALTILVNKAWQQTAIHGGKVQVDINYACNAVAIEINQIFENKVNQLIQVTKQIFSTNNVCYSNYSCSELLELYQQSKTYRLTLEFKDPPLSTNYAEHGIGYVGMVRLYEYKKFLTSENSLIRDDLFESNIRHFQGDVDVNRKIRRSIETIDNKDFWWLNNGITIIAESPSQIGKKLVIENVQIVNGLQTSYSIFSSHSGDSKDERSVLVKVIINNNKETIDAIIASTNSQNPVSSTLLRATEKTQRDLEIFFSTKGYYYDRRKNYYKNLGKPTAKIFSIQYAAQAIRAIVDNDPHTARAKPTSLLKDDRTYNQIFDPNRDFNGYLNCCIISKRVNDFWLNTDDTIRKNFTSNFKLHITWLASKISFGKFDVSYSEIVFFDHSIFDRAKFDETVDFLIEAIILYLQANRNANLINVAKSADFSKYVANHFAIKYAPS